MVDGGQWCSDATGSGAEDALEDVRWNLRDGKAQNGPAHHLNEVAKVAATPKVSRLRALPCMTMKVLLREPTRTPKARSKVPHEVT